MWFYILSFMIILADFLVDTWHMMHTHQELDVLFFLHIFSFVLTITLMAKAFLYCKDRLGRLTVQLTHLLNSFPCAVATIAPDFTIRAVNDALTRLTGFERELAVGKTCYHLFGDSKTVCPSCPVRDAYATGQVQQNVKRERTNYGTEIYIEQTAIPVVNREGEITHVLEIAIDATERMRLEGEKDLLFIQTVGALSKLIESRDSYTGTHSFGVESLAIEIGKELGLSQDVIEEISIAALLHDIGKIGIQENILNKPGKLSPEEYAIIQKHPELGYNTLKSIHSLEKIAKDILYHHERFDGHGYPTGKKGLDIPLVSRILSVADVYEAVTSDRVYRKAMSLEEAIRLMSDGRGTQFDPEIVDALLRVLTKFYPQELQYLSIKQTSAT